MRATLPERVCLQCGEVWVDVGDDIRAKETQETYFTDPVMNKVAIQALACAMVELPWRAVDDAKKRVAGGLRLTEEQTEKIKAWLRSIAFVNEVRQNVAESR